MARKSGGVGIFFARLFIVAFIVVTGILLYKKGLLSKQEPGQVLSENKKTNSASTGNSTVDGFVKGAATVAKDSANTVADIVTKIASDSAQGIKNKTEYIIIKSTVNAVVDQLNKLPQQEREEIKKEICK